MSSFYITSSAVRTLDLPHFFFPDEVFLALDEEAEAFECRDKSCAPPPIGTGGSRKTNAPTQGPGISVGIGSKKEGGYKSPELDAMSDEGKARALAVLAGYGFKSKTVEEAVDEVEARLMATIDVAEANGFGGRERVQATARWYDAANKYSNDMAEEFGYNHPETSAAVLATLSPSAAWESNVANARQVLKYVSENRNMTDDDVNDYVTRQTKALESKLTAVKGNPELAAEVRGEIEFVKSDANRAFVSGKILGKKFNDLDTDDAVNIINGNTQAKEMKGIALVPKADGSYGMAEYKGKAIVQSNSNTAKAIRLAQMDKNGGSADDMQKIIDRSVSSESKVRAFFMNIAHPMDTMQDAVTIDTHAFGSLIGLPFNAVTSKPLFNGTKEVGFANTYPIMRAALQRVNQTLIKRYGLPSDLPSRAAQSVTWEMERSILPAKPKGGIIKNTELIARVQAELDAGRPLRAKELLFEATQ